MENLAPRPNDPERHLPPDLLARASCPRGEYGWRIADIPRVIEAARAAGLVSLGGQLQFRFESGTCEVWSMEVQPHIPPGLSSNGAVARVGGAGASAVFSAVRPVLLPGAILD